MFYNPIVICFKYEVRRIPPLPNLQRLHPLPLQAFAIQQTSKETQIQTDTIIKVREQQEGFQTVNQFKMAMMIGNEKTLFDFKKYKARALDIMLHAHQPNEMPKFNILCQCADGRVAGPENFTKNPLSPDSMTAGNQWRGLE